MLSFDKKGNAKDQLAFAKQIESVFPRYAKLIRESHMNKNKINTEYSGTMKRVSKEDFDKLPLGYRGLPEYFVVLDTGQILIWPALDTSQVIFKCDLV